MEPTLGIFFVAVRSHLPALLIFLPRFPTPWLLFRTPISLAPSLISPRCKPSLWSNRRPLARPTTHQPTRFAYSPHVLPSHSHAAETSAYTRLDHGSLPAATHRPTWSRSSTSPTMMCVYRILPRQRTPQHPTRAHPRGRAGARSPPKDALF